MPKDKVTVVFEPEVMRALLERQEQKGYDAPQMVIYDILGEWYAAKGTPERQVELPPKKPIMLTLREVMMAQLAKQKAAKGYATLQMVIYDIVGEWYARQQQEEV
jgi:hypothetical protein